MLLMRMRMRMMMTGSDLVLIIYILTNLETPVTLIRHRRSATTATPWHLYYA